MFKRLKSYFANYETTMFYLMVIFYTILLLVGTLYPYARLPWERSYKTTNHEQTTHQHHDKHNKT